MKFPAVSCTVSCTNPEVLSLSTPRRLIPARRCAVGRRPGFDTTTGDLSTNASRRYDSRRIANLQRPAEGHSARSARDQRPVPRLVRLTRPSSRAADTARVVRPSRPAPDAPIRVHMTRPQAHSPGTSCIPGSTGAATGHPPPLQPPKPRRTASPRRRRGSPGSPRLKSPRAGDPIPRMYSVERPAGPPHHVSSDRGELHHEDSPHPARAVHTPGAP